MTGIAFVFPGQGSQQAGMGQALARSFPEARAAFEEADAALGEPLSAVCWNGPAEQLQLTATTQPAILATSVAAWRVLASRGLEPSCAAGHSLGEYTAHVACGTIDFADALRAVRARGRLMQEAVPIGVGAMAAVLGLELPAVEALCRESAGDEIVSPANLNGPGQVVVAGHAGAVSRVVARAGAAGARRAVLLPVSAPFHCALMRPAAEGLRPVLESITFSDPAVPVFANVDARPVTDGARARQLLLEQVEAPVRWEDAVRGMAATGVDTFVEIGPGKVLSGLVRRIVPGAQVLAVGDPASVESALRLLAGIA